LLARPRRANELEVLLLRRELVMLRRQGRPRLTQADRVLFVVLTRVPAGEAETVVRWHRPLVARRWTNPQ
jgi:hypothetical protein